MDSFSYKNALLLTSTTAVHMHVTTMSWMCFSVVDDGSRKRDKYVILISDGMDNDAQGNNPDSPVFAASKNRNLGRLLFYTCITKYTEVLYLLSS